MHHNILALSYISFSELQLIKPECTLEWAKDNLEIFKSYLYNLGLDSRLPFEYQIDIEHRNRLNQVVFGTRVVGLERNDPAWVESGYASQEAVDRSKNNALLNDLYGKRGLLEYSEDRFD
jgi:hypothetical protein